MFKRKLLISCVFLLAACGKQSELISSPTSSEEKQVQVTALATVNGEVIDEADLNTAIERTLGEYAAFQLDEKGRGKVLESLVLSKLMAQAQIKSMASDEISTLDKVVAAYREELLTKDYLKAQVSAEPVTAKMIETYYANNPHKFGGKTIKTYEIVKGLVTANGAVRNDILAAIEAFEVNDNWQDKVVALKNKGLQLEFSTGAVASNVLNADIDNILKPLSLNQMSTVQMIKGLPVVLKVVNESVIEPKPLSTVRADIRKSLAPLQLKKAVKAVADQLMQHADVVYMRANET